MSESMATGWYYLNRASGGDQQVGPLSWEQLYGVVAAGMLQAQDLVWHPALPQWTPAAQIQGLVPTPPAPSYEPPPAFAQSGERILAVAGNLVQAGGFLGMKQQAYSLIFTDYRVIFAQMTKERMTTLIEQARADAKAQDKGFLGQWGAQLGASSRHYEVYWQMSPEAALAETPGNFAIDRTAIEKVRFERGGIDDDNHSQPDYVTIKTSAGKFRLRVGGALSEVRGAFEDAGIG